MVTRRGFLGTCLALGAAPMIVRASSLMKVAAPVAAPSLELLWGLEGIVAADVNLGTYAGIDRATNIWWKGRPVDMNTLAPKEVVEMLERLGDQCFVRVPR